MIAVDSPVLIELLSDGPRADAVEACLRQALVGGRVVVCGTTLAELCAALRGGAEVQEALEEMGIHFSPLEAKSALRAGEMHRRHRQRDAADQRRRKPLACRRRRRGRRGTGRRRRGW